MIVRMTRDIVGFAIAGTLLSAACTTSRPRRATPAPAALAGIPAPGFTLANPFAKPSTLPFQAPPFDRIRNEDYQPALEEGMRVHLTEIRAIAGQPAAPTFDNTIVAMERSGRLLTRAARAFFGVIAANTNDTLQKVQEIEAPKLAAHSDAINLDEQLFQRVKALHDRRDALGLNAEQSALVDRYYRDFVRAGALLPPADKARMRALNTEESRLTTQFQNRLLAATKAGAVVVDDAKELTGLSDAEIATTASAANERTLSGRYVIALQNTTQQPLQSSLSNRSLGEPLFNA
jgi:peptidyl-dipeptidase Dcp